MTTGDAWEIAQKAAAFEGVVPNALEAVSLTFAISGVSRATTHQLVRTRVGASFGQQSLRANNASGFNVRIPRTTRMLAPSAMKAYRNSLPHLRKLYDELIAAGVPYQDARYFLPMATETSIVASYNLLSLIGTVQRRICNRMQWEINYVARLMADLATEALPWVGRAFRTKCERTGICQTIDPMFEPSCYHDGEFVKDNPVLVKKTKGEHYNWPRHANDAWMLFASLDEVRTARETAFPDEVWSLANRERQLLIKKLDYWRRSN